MISEVEKYFSFARVENSNQSRSRTVVVSECDW